MNSHQIKWEQLLHEAVEKPGSILAAYSQFHNYSLGNCMLALMQCHQRGIQPGPMAPYKRWQELGRHVRRGEKALTLCMPLTVKKKQDQEDGEPEVRTVFVFRNKWFVLSQTEGETFEPEPIPVYDRVLDDGLGPWSQILVCDFGARFSSTLFFRLLSIKNLGSRDGNQHTAIN
jgi:hypothetical protein